MNILLVEDNPGDVRLTQEALKEGEFFQQIRLHVVPDGEEALLYLHRKGPYAQAELPDLIFLDLNLPRKDGWEVLEEIKNTPGLRRIPVVVLTTSEAEHHIDRCYELHANCYISKPVDISQFIEVIRSIENFWIKIVKLPSKN
jgi:two-component system, chemotaxis family, response regulator Rcp1